MLNQKIRETGSSREIAVNDIASSFIVEAINGYEIRQRYTRGNKTQAHGRSRFAQELQDTGRSETEGRAYLVPGRFFGEEWIFNVRGEETLVDRVLVADQHVPWPSLSHDLGRCLAALHDHSTEHGLPTPVGPDAYLRLDAWFKGLSRDFYGAHFNPVVRESIGDPVWSTLSAWCQALVRATETTTCHGQFGMGTFSVLENNPVLEVLTGPALCIAHPSSDIGYYIGELLEMSRTDRISPEDFQQALQSFEAGYGRALMPEDFRAGILRILMHQHDYVAYAAHMADPEVHENLRFVRYLVESGMGSR
ncbi:hypothetical protein [Pseudarthrobacter polychromogenes]|uniref:Aminoglycoside phosphotransferase domain-containing protein n=1 Tax=Pseudarthrobacter polychromogenes TaxID=1676 RepID=A0ABQ1XKE4_9MICC|nr:hypothetical protein [Pseudarthrobacter polychromogenes]MBD1593701.1 hypothetical protein [Arthrobacter sp. S1_S22]GGG95936.1 hypothetical protein GCM10011577_18810 [Pseudarthrobacter polychromogenes]